MKRIVLALSILLAGSLLSVRGQDYPDMRPAPENRLFSSPAVEAQIEKVESVLTNAKLKWMFRNCYPNTLDTTVNFDPESGLAFVVTGDIRAMWLRDSGAQVWPYVKLARKNPELQALIKAVVRNQMKMILLDAYANAFNNGPTGEGWRSDVTPGGINPGVYERKWELDSVCYPIRLAYEYWKETGDKSIFDTYWVDGVKRIYEVLLEQQRKEGVGSYSFLRTTDRQLDTKSCGGLGNPVNPVGLIASSFRPSDDATTFEFHIPSNFMAVSALRKAAEISRKVVKDRTLAKNLNALASEVEKALKKYAVYDHPKYGKIYAYEIDGFGNRYLMDDANVPSLLSLPYISDVSAKNRVYKNTRKFVLSPDNPWFFSGSAGEGIGGPHIGYDMIWPMSIIMRAFTSTDDAEIKMCVETLVGADAGSGFIHESFYKDDALNFTRPWFAWANSLFGELIIYLVDSGKAGLLNSIDTES